MPTSSDAVRSLFITGLKDAHALENQALALMNRQIERLESYPDVLARMQQHKTETDGQILRVEEILSSLGESHSMLKDAALTMSGNMAALMHSVAGDEILKNSFANFAFENFEAASYKSLITMAEAGGFNAAVPLLQATLQEELAMAAWLDQNLSNVTQRFMALRASGQQASH